MNIHQIQVLYKRREKKSTCNSSYICSRYIETIRGKPKTNFFFHFKTISFISSSASHSHLHSVSQVLVRGLAFIFYLLHKQNLSKTKSIEIKSFFFGIKNICVHNLFLEIIYIIVSASKENPNNTLRRVQIVRIQVP